MPPQQRPAAPRTYADPGASSSRASAPAPRQQYPVGTSGRPRAQARVYAATQQEAAANPDVVTGTLTLFSMDACVLIDPGSTHSYISVAFAARASETPSELD